MARSLSDTPKQPLSSQVWPSRSDTGEIFPPKQTIKSEFMRDHEVKLYLIRFLVQQEELPDTGESQSSKKRKQEMCGDAQKKEDIISNLSILMALVCNKRAISCQNSSRYITR